MQKLKQQQMFDRVFERLPDHVTLLLIIISGFLLARLTWMMFPSDPSITARVETEQTDQGVSVMQAHATSKNLGNEIAAHHLLGVYQPPKAVPAAAPVKQVEAPKAKPKPREPLNLVGVYALNDKDGVAVIDIKGKQEVVGLNEQIGETSAILKKVYANRVDVAWDDGETQTLEMPNIDRSALGAMEIPPEQQLQPEPEQPIVQPASFDQPADLIPQQPPVEDEELEEINQQQEDPAADPMLQGRLQPSVRPQKTAANNQPSAPARSEEQGQAAVSLGDFKQEIVNNNINLLQVIRPSPRRENGQLIGFAVRPGTNRALFNQTGLRSGDVVTEINGMALTNNQVSRQAMQSLVSASGATLTVLRGGEPTTVQVTF
ncbi:MAG: type II secretion system protein N [Thiolinea sp.]